jgi:mitochondrial fission protein ELM1
MAQPAGTATDDILGTVAGRSGWIISDGKAGNDVQSRGVFDVLQLDYRTKHVEPTGIWKLLAPWGPVNPAERLGAAGSAFQPPWPEFAIAIGRLTIPYLRRLRRLAGRSTYTIILLDPRVGASAADLIWVPEHDRLRGPNVVTTLTSPHGFTQRRLAELRQTIPPAIAALPQPRVAVGLGGPNGDYRYTPQALERLARALHAFAGKGAGLMITPSRRTPAEVRAYVREATEGLPRLFWDGEGENLYPYFLAHADFFIAPADSVNMCGEPCATGKPVYVFEPEGGSAKFSRFHEALRRHGAARPLPGAEQQLETWSYPPLNSAETIAREIARRWLKRRQMLGTKAAS